MKVICFVGSGFNYMLADIIKPHNIYTKDDIPLHEEIIRLNHLWYHLDPLLSPFNNFIPTKYGEELLEAVGNFNKAYNKFIGRADDDNFITAAMFASRIKEEMQKIGQQFTKFEVSGGYSCIHAALPNLGKALQDLINSRRVESLYLCTTNYDGIVDSLLTYYCEKEQKKKFILKDGFIHGRYNDWLFRKSKYKIAHLHGSYKYFKDINGTIKIERGAANNDPVMIYDDPNCKETAIRADSVLSANFLELERQLRECDKVIIIGNSFKTEPHLKKLLKNNFNRPNTQMLVCSDKPEKVVSVLEPYYDFPIYTQCTDHIKSEKQLIELFEKLFNSKRSDLLATA